MLVTLSAEPLLKAASVLGRPSPDPDPVPAAKGKFQDLDAFLNSDTEEEGESAEDRLVLAGQKRSPWLRDNRSEPEGRTPHPVTAPPQSAIVPEYDGKTSDEEDTPSDEESDEEQERAPLYGQYR